MQGVTFRLLFTIFDYSMLRHITNCLLLLSCRTGIFKTFYLHCRKLLFFDSRRVSVIQTLLHASYIFCPVFGTSLYRFVQLTDSGIENTNRGEADKRTEEVRIKKKLKEVDIKTFLFLKY